MVSSLSDSKYATIVFFPLYSYFYEASRWLEMRFIPIKTVQRLKNTSSKSNTDLNTIDIVEILKKN